VLVYALRLGSATRPQRRALIAVASTSLLFMPVFFVYHFSRQVLEIDPARLETLGWAVIGCRVLLPLGFLVALWQAELFAAGALRRLLDRLTARPTPAQWRDGVAAALDDPALQIGYWDPVAEQYREDAGAELVPPPAGSGRIWVPAARDERPQAAMVVDAVLVEDPELVRVAAAATVLAVENGALEGEVRTSRSRILEAGHAERRRIERDLHDSAQQRLVALGIRLGLASEQLDGERDRALAKELGAQVDEALEELRTVAAGAPRTLRDSGIAAALRVAATASPIAVTIRDDGVGRHSEALESTVYFCCVEALQNAAKHGGSGTSALVRLARENRCVTFAVEDDGEGFDPATARPGSGLRNLSERVAAVGGTVAIESSPDGGTRVVGRLPV
jgi:signal transduction histidine kinase